MVILIVGSTVLVVGLAMILLPGPAFIVIPAGLGILGLEFLWARRWLCRIRVMVGKARRAVGLGEDKAAQAGCDSVEPSESSDRD